MKGSIQGVNCLNDREMSVYRARGGAGKPRGPGGPGGPWGPSGPGTPPGTHDTFRKTQSSSI